MERKITWLHLSDLHYGQQNLNILLPKIKRELLKDIEYLKNETGKIDVVFFSGDLTQSGSEEEFAELTVFLKELWSVFKKLGSEPYLIAVPGNHDLFRPDQKRAVVKVMKSYQDDADLQATFWDGIKAKNENYELINQCFKNFDQWYKRVDLPKPDLTFGLIPGDISTNISINNVLIKVVGLNTAFLELSSDDYFGKLAMHPEQVMAVTSNNPLEWLESAEVSILMTHHDPTWLDNKSTDYYNNDINPPNTFNTHLCGHLHKPFTSESRLLGSELRRVQLAPSLFGLLKIGTELDRIHGYYAGTYRINENSIYERFYPRVASKRYDGSYSIVPDNGFNLDNKSYIESIFHGKQDSIPAVDISAKSLDIEEPENASIENILDLKSSTDNIRELDRVPKVTYTPTAQHISVRLVEQKQFLQLLHMNRQAWLITDWGLNEAGFIGSVADQLGLDRLRSGFTLNCEDIINEKELLIAFEDQFGMALQRFCNLVANLKNSLLVFDHVNFSLYSNPTAYNRFLDIAKSIKDFCPNLYIIVIARQAPNQLHGEGYVKLAPLDGSEIKSYLSHHSGNMLELQNSENILKLLEVTSGLPKHVDRFIENLKVASFQELLESEQTNSSDFVSIDQIPKSLKQTISNLSDSTDRSKARSFKLLKILTVLANGEIMGNLKRFDGSEPIYIENANELEQLSLLEVVTMTRVLSKLSTNTTQEIKILRIPRQIRDYVQTLITDSERDNIMRFACDMYFGNKWRRGEIKDIYTSSGIFKSLKFFNIDNCHLITNFLLSTAFKNNKDGEIQRAANLAVNVCTQIFKHEDYKNALNCAEELYNWLRTTSLNKLKATTAKLLGQALRMTGSRERSIQILNEALLMDGVTLSNDEKGAIYVDLGYAYLQEGRKDKALDCARELEKISSPKGSYYLQAKYIKVKATTEDGELAKKLRLLESEAKKESFHTLLNNISLDIVSLETNREEKDKRLQKILESKEQYYNKVRAVVTKSLNALTNEDGSTSEDGELSPEDLPFLNLSYSYLYMQRLEGLFNSCHKALWIYCVKEGLSQELLNLYKHSSLVWRISDNIKLEKKYFMALETTMNTLITGEQDQSIRTNMDYYLARKEAFDALTSTEK